MNTRSQNNITVTPTAMPYLSPTLAATGAPLLSSVTIRGIEGLSAHTVRLSVYGMSKSGFFLERRTVNVGELFFKEHEGDLFIDLHTLSFSIRREFFFSLQVPTSGKICVEANVDGVRMIGDTPITLLPARMLPQGASPSVFAAALTPFHSEITRIVSNLSTDAKDLYGTLKREAVIYSVKDCDFLRHAVNFDDIDRLCRTRARMMSPLEMAQMFCACALRLGLAPILVAAKTAKASRFYCGAMATNMAERFCGAVLKKDELSAALETGTLSVFDISALFTGHNVEYEDACRRAAEELQESEPTFAADLRRILRDGTDLFGLYPEQREAEKAFVDALRAPTPCHTLSLSALAEELTDSENTPLLHFDKVREALPIRLSAFSLWNERAALSDCGIVSVLPEESDSDELTHIQRIDNELRRSQYIETLAELEEKGFLGVPVERATLFDRFDALTRGGVGELYLACGFLSRGETLAAPCALFPIRLYEKDGKIRLRFLSARPYVNRLLCETVNDKGAQGFFTDYGLPSGNPDEVLAAFEALCRRYDFTLRKEAYIARFPYRDSVLAFETADKSEKIRADKLAARLLTDTNDKPESEHSEGLYREAIRKFEGTTLEPLSNDVQTACVRVRDEDLLLDARDEKELFSAARGVAVDNLAHGLSTLILAQSEDTLEALRDSFDECGLTDAVLKIDGGEDTKQRLRDALAALSQADLPGVELFDETEYALLREKLAAYRDAKGRRYDFDVSFYDAARAFTAAGDELSDEEREISVEPETLFYPDMAKETVARLFALQHALCRSALALGEKKPLKEHPFYRAKLTDETVQVQTVEHLLEKCRLAYEHFTPLAVDIAGKAGYSFDELPTIAALHAFLSLALLTVRENTTCLTEALLCADVYALSGKLSALKTLAGELAVLERELCEFNEEIYTLPADELIHGRYEGKDLSHNELARVLNAYRTVSVPADFPKKSCSEVLALLCRHVEQKKEFDQLSAPMCELFGESWNGELSDWNKLREAVELAKNVDVYLKKIFGTDTERRFEAARRLPNAVALLSEKAVSDEIYEAASLFDRMFGDDGTFVSLGRILHIDWYDLSFDGGVFASDGLLLLLDTWQENAASLLPTAAYNRQAEFCRKEGLGCFVDYLEDHVCTPQTEAIFTRSQLHMILKQIALYDKRLLNEDDYEKDRKRFAQMHRKRIARNRAEQKRRYVERCVAYIRENPEKSTAFSEDLYGDRVSAEEILLRYGELLHIFFPIRLATPSFVGLLSGFETVVFADAGRLSPSRALAAFPLGRHKLLLSDEYRRENGSIFALLSEKNTARLTLSDNRNRTRSIKLVRSPISEFNGNTLTNVPEAQTVGLELMRAIEKETDRPCRIAVLGLTLPQTKVLKDIVGVLCEKSAAVHEAFSNGSVDVLYAAEPLVRSYDLCLVGTVYGTESLHAALGNDAETIERLLSLCLAGRADRTVIVTSLVAERYPEPIGNRFALSAFSTAEAAHVGANAYIAPERESFEESAFVTEFCRLLSRKNIPVCLGSRAGTAHFTVGNRSYTAVFDRTGDTVFAAECADETACADENENRIFVDSVTLYLNPQKLYDTLAAYGAIDRVSEICEENENNAENAETEKEKEGTV